LLAQVRSVILTTNFLKFLEQGEHPCLSLSNMNSTRMLPSLGCVVFAGLSVSSPKLPFSQHRTASYLEACGIKTQIYESKIEHSLRDNDLKAHSLRDSDLTRQTEVNINKSVLFLVD
jgi:hypothetical protein